MGYHIHCRGVNVGVCNCKYEWCKIYIILLLVDICKTFIDNCILCNINNNNNNNNNINNNNNNDNVLSEELFM